MKIQDIQRKKFRGSSPGTEIRQKFVEWVRNLRTIDDRPLEKSNLAMNEPRATRTLESMPTPSTSNPEPAETSDATPIV